MPNDGRTLVELEHTLSDAHPRILTILRGGAVGDRQVAAQLVDLYEGIAAAMQRSEQQQNQRRQRSEQKQRQEHQLAAAFAASGAESPVELTIPAVPPPVELVVEDDDTEAEAGPVCPGPRSDPGRAGLSTPSAATGKVRLSTPSLLQRMPDGRKLARTIGERTSAFGHQFQERVVERVASPSRFLQQRHQLREGSSRRKRHPQQWQPVAWPEHRPWFCGLATLGCTAVFLVEVRANGWALQPFVCAGAGPSGLPTHEDGSACEANLMLGPTIRVLDDLGAKNDRAIFERGEWWRLLLRQGRQLHANELHLPH